MCSVKTTHLIWWTPVLNEQTALFSHQVEHQCLQWSTHLQSASVHDTRVPKPNLEVLKLFSGTKRTHLKWQIQYRQWLIRHPNHLVFYVIHRRWIRLTRCYSIFCDSSLFCTHFISILHNGVVLCFVWFIHILYLFFFLFFWGGGATG